MVVVELSRLCFSDAVVGNELQRAREAARHVLASREEQQRRVSVGGLEVGQHRIKLFIRQLIEYKKFTREEPLRFDLLVEDCLLVEAKAVEKILPIHKAQLLSYMKLMDVPLGLLINFHELKVADGISRLILPGANL